MAKIRLMDVARYYRAQDLQIKALEWLQASTGQAKQEEFGKRYRKGADGTGIDFVKAARYYEAQPHQIEAWQWLENNTQEKVLTEFARLWRLKPQSNYYAQMTHFGTRLPQSPEHESNIRRMVGVLEALEAELGVKLSLTSGYRPEPINSQVGGVANSQHTTGCAADIYSVDMDDFELERCIIDYWYAQGRGGVGRGMAYRGFVHVDLGPVRIWDY